MRYAQGVQRPARISDGEAAGRPAPGSALRVHQQAPYAHQNPLLGWNWVVGADQAAGRRNLFVAEEPGARDHQAQALAAGLGDADRWSGFAQRKTAPMV